MVKFPQKSLPFTRNLFTIDTATPLVNYKVQTIDPGETSPVCKCWFGMKSNPDIIFILLLLLKLIQVLEGPCQMLEMSIFSLDYLLSGTIQSQPFHWPLQFEHISTVKRALIISESVSLFLSVSKALTVCLLSSFIKHLSPG